MKLNLIVVFIAFLNISLESLLHLAQDAIIYSNIFEDNDAQQSYLSKKLYQSQYWVFEESNTTSNNFSYAAIKLEKNVIKFYETKKTTIRLRPVYSPSYSRIVGIGNILVPTFQEFFEYASSIQSINSIYYDEYYEKVSSYCESFKKLVSKRENLEYCRVLQEYKQLLPHSIYSDIRIYVLCFDDEKEMKTFIKMLMAKYILSVDALPVSSILNPEPGRAFKVYYDRADYKNILHEYSMRFLDNSLAFYSIRNKNNYFLEEGLTYSAIQDCKVGHGHFLNLSDIRNNPNVSCCVFFNRRWNNNTITLEYLCSVKTSLDICVFEARQLQKEIIYKCQKSNPEKGKSITYQQIYEQFLGEDEKIRDIVEIEPRERGNLKCLICDK